MNESIVVCAQNEQGIDLLFRYSFQHNTMSETVILDEKPTGMTEVVLGGTPCIAVSWG